MAARVHERPPTASVGGTPTARHTGAQYPVTAGRTISRASLLGQLNVFGGA